MNPHLHPDSKAFLKRLNERAQTALNGSNLLELPPEQARVAFNQLTAPVEGKLKPIEVHVEDKTINLEDSQLTVRLYKPKKDMTNLPALIYCHGGGYVFGELDFLDYACRALCQGAECLVVQVGFRRAPEHKFPTAHMDCYNVARYVQTHASEFGSNGVLAVGGG
ncbi:alpha/beta hydrolase [Legionella jordanis]|uniref:alpha/beta hydrolase n=1 Tax=Legionella jordanis TaxID=456 RepID=UPI001604DD31|nr:alpha/beta hydrolase [Legionella jordanis]